MRGQGAAGRAAPRRHLIAGYLALPWPAGWIGGYRLTALAVSDRFLYNPHMQLSVWTRLFLLLALIYIAFLVVLSRSKGNRFWKHLLVAAAFLAAPWKVRKFK